MGASAPKPTGTYLQPFDSGTLTLANAKPPTSVCSECKAAFANGQAVTCPCIGNEASYVAGLKPIASYTGNLPSPLQVMWYVPEDSERGQTFWPDSQIRGWIRDAAQFHGIPHVMLALILQQENGPNATKTQKLGQFAERSLTTFSAIADRYLWDLVPDRIAGSSSGFANMSRATLENTARYTERTYCRGLLPHSVRYRQGGWDQYNLISGDDWKADLYYAAAHMRQLIDRVTGRTCHNGALSLEQLRSAIRAYNGSGPKADKYADDAMNLLDRAQAGTATLYFYEK